MTQQALMAALRVAPPRPDPGPTQQWTQRPRSCLHGGFMDAPLGRLFKHLRKDGYTSPSFRTHHLAER